MNKLTTLALGSLCLAGAFYLGRWTAAPVTSDTTIVSGYPLPLAPAPLNQLESAPAVATQVAAALPERPSFERDQLGLQQLLELAKTAPTAALEQAQQLKSQARQTAQAAILAQWATTNPAAAWQWLEDNQAQNSRAHLALLKAMGSSQPQAALDFADSYAHAHREMKKDIYLAAIQGLARAGRYDSATFLIDYLDPSEGIKAELVSALVGLWAPYEPETAMQWLNQQPSNQTQVGRLGAIWAEQDPEAATRFAQQNPGQENAQLMQTAFEQWLHSDPQAAASWISAQPSSAELDPMLSRLADQLGQDPGQISQALDLAGRIGEPRLRQNTLLSLLSPIKQANSLEASTYIDRLSYLSETERESLKRELALVP